MDAESNRLIDRVRLEGGAGQDDLHFIERTLAQLFTQLDRFDPSQVDISIRFKDRGQPGMRTTLDVRVQGLPALVGVSHLEATKDALNDAEAKVLSQLRSHVSRNASRRTRP
ncbi:hypothetical protein [Intrasporangium sp.]|uniref:hypothetical protein n=1 Tax=Intrasporangium sp. TaxID=1925024 RepID=UPI003221F375